MPETTSSASVPRNARPVLDECNMYDMESLVGARARFYRARYGALCPTLSGCMLAEASLLVALTVQYGPGAEACLAAPALKRSVEKRLKRTVFVEPDRAALRFVVSFQKQGEDTEARIDVASIDGTPRGSRSLVTHKHCSSLDDSLALSVALLVDQPPEPEEAPPSPSPSTTPVAAPAAPPRRTPTPITLPADVEAPREPWHAAFGVTALAIWGAVPAVAPGVALYLRVLPRHFAPVTLQGEWIAPQSVSRDATSGARFRLLRAALALCPTLVEGTERSLGVCVGQKLGWLDVAGYGFDHDGRERRLSYALNVGGEGRLRLFAPISARAYLGAELPLVRDRFASGGNNPSQLFRPSPVSLAGEIGLEAALW